ncbi:DUF4376 domain-containing protein [Massilia antarctica]|uniref:DUF4376 domain-containing protein n=1 Tax=Massilia antarctica TaxID=2765360 RepID=UPI002270E24E|nr:hypothetical protein [Massilia sp. H27-R4]MCY0916245.1 hypothetical protein [Massilia sp. H27-R4]
MQFYRLRDGTLPNVHEIRQQNPGIGIPDTPDDLSMYGYEPFLDSPAPAVGEGQSVVRRAPKRSGQGVWDWTWDIVERSEQEIEAEECAREEAKREVAKAARAARVAGIQVTTKAGNAYDGDEVSQGRMARAIVALQAAGVPSVRWVLADNSVISATVADLAEALALAGAVQAAMWVIQP